MAQAGIRPRSMRVILRRSWQAAHNIAQTHDIDTSNRILTALSRLEHRWRRIERARRGGTDE